MTGTIGDSPAVDHPLLSAFRDGAANLSGSGGPFELVDEEVLGETVLVFRNRLRSMRELLQRAEQHGDHDCYVFSDRRRITFEQLPQQVASVAAYLRDHHGIGPGDRVAICGANGAGWLLSLWATTSLGAVTVAMNGWWSEPEMLRAIELTEPKLLLFDEKRAARLTERPSAPMVDLERDLEAMLAFAPDAGLPEHPIDEDDPAILIFTSGTTGRPKAAVLTHRIVIAFCMEQTFIGACLAMIGQSPTLTAPPRRLAVFPLFHVSGLGGAISGALTGVTSVWPLGRFDAEQVIDLTVREGISFWAGTTTHIRRLLDHPDLDRIPPGQLAQVSMGGSATTPEDIRRLNERFPHLAGTMSSGYGSTEVGGLATFAPSWLLAAAADCVGPPLAGVQVRITDDDGGALEDGEVGHIWVRSALVMPGYWRQEEADAESFIPGRWYRTGDYGRVEGGLLFIASRLRDLIIRGGENIYPIEIENRLEEHPAVAEAAVVGVDDDVFGQAVLAMVVVAADYQVTGAELQRFCAEGLASYKVPALIDLRAEPLPRNASGKVMKHVLMGDATNEFSEE